MKLIPLTQGKFAQVDDEDFEWLNQWKWYANKYHNTYYAVRNIWIPNHSVILMHSVILNTPKGMSSDHIDHNGLNNQRYNLRIVTQGQNNYNNSIMSNNTSGYKGVSWRKDKNKWEAYINKNHMRNRLGLFNTAAEAAKAYDKAAINLFGEFANINFKYEEKND